MERIYQSFIKKVTPRQDFLWQLAEVDETTLRKLWLLGQYQSNRQGKISSQEAHKPLVERFKLGPNGDRWVRQKEGSQSGRRQLLGKMHELKLKFFRDYVVDMREKTGIDLYEAAVSMPVVEIIYDNKGGDLKPLADVQLRVPRNDWDSLVYSIEQGVAVPNLISLPRPLAEAFEAKFQNFATVA